MKKPFHLIISVLICLALFVPKSYAFLKDTLTVHFIDVGYADAILILFPDHSSMMIDTGTQGSSQKVIDYLNKFGVTSLDTVIITHPHENHFGGLTDLMNEVSIKQVYVNGQKEGDRGYMELIQTIKDSGIKLKSLKRGGYVKTGVENVDVDILHPSDLKGNYNGNSIVTWISYHQTFFLLTADIEPKQQRTLIEENQFIQKAQCVQIPHHGWPPAKEFVTSFKKASFVISTGPNKWNVPDEKGLKENNNTIYRTDRDGSVIFQSDGFTMSVLDQ